jgi:hypothetical protein
MAKVQHVFDAREAMEKAVAESGGKLSGFQVNGAYVAARNGPTAVFYAYREGKLEGVECNPLAAPPTEEAILECLSRLSEKGRAAALKALGRKEKKATEKEATATGDGPYADRY